MSAPNYWRELIGTPAASLADVSHEQADYLERLANLAECQGERMSAGIAAIGELLDNAASANRLDEGVAVDICSMLAALSGLAAQLATVSRNAHQALAMMRTALSLPHTIPLLPSTPQE